MRPAPQGKGAQVKADWTHLEQFRGRGDRTPANYRTETGEKQGVFYLMKGSIRIIAIASSGDEEIPWEHVSARVVEHRGDRCPNWEEMCWLKDLFWNEEEVVVQFHPKRSEYVNNHAAVLHLWKWLGGEIPTPPSIAVGYKGLEQR